MEKSFVRILVAGLLFLSQASFAQTKNELVVRLGVTVPLTGDFASYGELIRKGVELARRDLEKEGYGTEVFFEDACLPANAVSTIQKLIAGNKIHALTANFCVIAVPPMAPMLERNRIITFHTASTSDSILNAGSFIFSTNVKVHAEARMDAERAWNDLGAKTASVLFIATDLGEDYNKYFSARFEELGGKIVSSDRSPIGVNDFKAELTRVKSKNPDVLFAAHLGLTLGVLLKQKQAMGISAKVIGQYEAEDPSVLEIAQSAAEGIEFFVPEPVVETTAVKNFRRAYKKLYGEDARILAGNAYDGTVISTKSLIKCKLDPECAKQEIYKIKNYDGASGSFSFDADGGVKRELVLKTVKNGKFVRVY